MRKRKAQSMTGQVFYENEINANLLVGRFLIVCAVGLALCWFLNSLGVFAIGKEYVLRIFPVGIGLVIVPAAMCLSLRGRRRWIKYLILLGLIVTLAYLDTILTFNVPLFITLPVIFSCWYYSCSFTVQVSLLTTVAFSLSAYIGAYLNFDTPDMNFASPDSLSYIRDVMLQSFLPRWMLFLIVSAVCYIIAKRGRSMVITQDQVSKANARVEAELEMANRIQSQALPTARELPGNSHGFELAARMMPAKEVGGDFYDFFYIDPTHLALIIADVADKGIGAALYMMMSKLMLSNRLTVCSSPGRALEDVNRQLHEKSAKGMFVTVWLGVLDLQTGDLITANAGHEYPAIRQADGEFRLLKDRHGFVLGGVSSMKYRETQLHLEPGDILFVYTDGVPEANSPGGQMFGEERMLRSLNAHADGSMDELIDSLKRDMDYFADGAPQFDDTTMLALRFIAPAGNELRVKPEMDELDRVQSCIDKVMSHTDISSLQAKKIHICADEIFSNIVNYGSASAVTVSCRCVGEKLTLVFTDDGIAFDPLSAESPRLGQDMVKSDGGLGIYIAGKYADSMDYVRENGKNVLTLTANIVKEVHS